MRGLVIFVALFMLLAMVGLAQQINFEGTWEGTVESPQGQQQAKVTLKKNGDNYVGSITGLRGEQVLKDVKVDGNKFTAISELESPQGTIVINYKFTVEGDSLKGEVQVDFGGQIYNFAYDLKRVKGQSTRAKVPKRHHHKHHDRRLPNHSRNRRWITLSAIGLRNGWFAKAHWARADQKKSK